MQKLILSSFFILSPFLLNLADAQVYLADVNGTVPLDLCSCSTGTPLNPQQSNGLAVGFNQNPYIGVFEKKIFMINATTGMMNLVANMPENCNNLVMGADGLLYAVGAGASGIMNLYTINPNNGVVTNLGQLPAGIVPQGDLFFYNGELYMLSSISGASGIVKIPVNNPINTMMVFTFTTLTNLYASISLILNGVQTVIIYGEDSATGAEGLFTLNMTTGAYTPFCPGLFASDLGAPPNLNIDCCGNYAGTFLEKTLVTLCENEPVSLHHLGDHALVPGSSLTFLLLSQNPALLPDHVVAMSNTPVFNFNPATMSINTVYYVVAIAAPTTNGIPNWAAACKHLSAYTPVVWKPMPTVTLAATPPDLCQNGCVSIVLNLTGDFPITIEWSATIAGSPVQGNWVASNSPATFQFCAPPNAPAGNLTINLTGISNAFCSCD